MAQNEKRGSFSIMSNGPILISSQPANTVNTSYASSLGAKANSAIKNLMVTSSEHDNSSKKARRAQPPKKEHVIIESKTTPQQQSSVNNQHQQQSQNLEAGRGFHIIIDKNSLQNMSLGSPTDTKSGTSKHRGYSLLNMPVNVVVSDDVDGEGQFDQDVTAMAHSPTFGLTSKFPDLFFQGWSIQPLESTLAQSRERRMTRRLKALARKSALLMTGEATINEKLLDQSSYEQSSLTEHKHVSNKIQNEPNRSQVVDSNASKTQSPYPTVEENERLEIQDGTIESANAKGYQAIFINKSIADEAEERPAFQTQSISIANGTLETLGDQTFRTNVREQYIQVTPRDYTIESQQEQTIQQQILASSSSQQQQSRKAIDIENQPHILASSSIESYGTIMKRNSKQIVKQHVDPPRGNKQSPKGGLNLENQRHNSVKAAPTPLNRTLVKATKQSQKLPAETAKQEPRKTVPINPKVTNDRIQKTTHVTVGGASTKFVQAASRKNQNNLKQPSPVRPLLNKSSNASVRKEITSESPQRNAQPVSPKKSSKASQNWQNSSQDRILLNNSKQAKRNGQKKAPPVQPGL